MSANACLVSLLYVLFMLLMKLSSMPCVLEGCMVLETVVLGSVCFLSYKGAEFCLYIFCDVCHLLCGLSPLFICYHVFAVVACSCSPVLLPGSVCSQVSGLVVMKYLNLASVSFSFSFCAHSCSAGYFLS